MTAAEDLAIRLRRAAFNRVIAERDLTAIGSLLAPAAIMITGSDSAVLSGRKAQLQTWKREFAADRRMVYVLTPIKVEISAVEPVAMETGNWQGVMAATQAPLAGGSYSAKWRRFGSEWMVEAEIFVTLA